MKVYLCSLDCFLVLNFLMDREVDPSIASGYVWEQGKSFIDVYLKSDFQDLENSFFLT